jgi:hypothetical protein
MEDVKTILNTIEENLVSILNWTAVVISLFFGWLLASQVVILSKGWEMMRTRVDPLEGEDS